MRVFYFGLLVMNLCAVLVASEVRAQETGHNGHGAHGAHAPAGVVAKEAPVYDEATQALVDAMNKMHVDMDIPLTGNADADFVRGMIPHHEGAVAMAQIVIKYGNDPEARKLAAAILRAQRGEIALMQRWLERRQIPQRDAIKLNP